MSKNHTHTFIPSTLTHKFGESTTLLSERNLIMISLERSKLVKLLPPRPHTWWEELWVLRLKAAQGKHKQGDYQ